MESNKDLVDFLVNSGALRTPEIIYAFLLTDRKDFVPEALKERAYEDVPLPIGRGQTISQPSTVATMTEALRPSKGMKILEIGTGSGYQAAILSIIAGKQGKVITIEMKEEIFALSKNSLGFFENVVLVKGDGSSGYAKEAPYDRIIVTAASPSVPEPLKEQLKSGGIMVIPVGTGVQKMAVVSRTGDMFEEKFIGEFRFVPLLGKHGFSE